MGKRTSRLWIAGIVVGIFLSFSAFIPTTFSMSSQDVPDVGLLIKFPQPQEQPPFLPPTFESSSFLDSFSGGKVDPNDPDPSLSPTIIPSPAPIQITRPQSLPVQEDLKALFETYGKEFGINPDKLASIARCESHYNPQAVNGPYGGMFQYHPNTWVSDRKKRGWDPDPNLRFDARESIRTAAAKISSGGLGAWPVCGFK